MKVEIQNYEPSDKLYVWETYVYSMKHYVEEIWGWDDAWQQNDFETGFEKYETKILKLDQSKIGYLQFKQESKYTYISMLVLNPKYQSKGIGFELLNTLQPGTPDKSLRLNCFKINESAYKFYLKCGFKAFKTDEKFIYLERNTNA